MTAWAILLCAGIAICALGSNLYMDPRKDWIFTAGTLCVVASMAVGVAASLA